MIRSPKFASLRDIVLPDPKLWLSQYQDQERPSHLCASNINERLSRRIAEDTCNMPTTETEGQIQDPIWLEARTADSGKGTLNDTAAEAKEQH